MNTLQLIHITLLQHLDENTSTSITHDKWIGSLQNTECITLTHFNTNTHEKIITHSITLTNTTITINHQTPRKSPTQTKINIEDPTSLTQLLTLTKHPELTVIYIDPTEHW